MIKRHHTLSSKAEGKECESKNIRNAALHTGGGEIENTLLGEFGEDVFLLALLL